LHLCLTNTIILLLHAHAWHVQQTLEGSAKI